MLKDTMPYVKRELTIRQIHSRIHELRSELTRMAALNIVAVSEVSKRHIKERIRLISNEIATANHDLRDSLQTVPVTKAFVHKCPATDCKGFITTEDMTCEICKTTVCDKCLQVDSGKHTCDQSSAISISTIAHECRNCPNCMIPIFKNQDGGCDQMFCTRCHAIFSWATGRLDTTGRYHNPHYFEHLRTLNNGEMPRQHGDLPRGGLPDIVLFMNFMSDNAVPKHVRSYLIRVFMSIRHILHVMYRFDEPAPDNTQLRVRFILNELTDSELARVVQQREKSHAKNTTIHSTMQNLVLECVKILHDIMDKGLSLQHLLELERLREEYNKYSTETSRCYQTTLNPVIENSWSRVRV